ncbi:MAG: hypothetical protein HYZ81_26375 [Nitrospinae bacterium]|nr:hypothetical protein [Nitrospinota bacterium]
MSLEKRGGDDQAQGRSSRRGFFKGLLIGVGTAAALAAGKKTPQAGEPEETPEKAGTPEPILYHRTEYVDRYFRTFR